MRILHISDLHRGSAAETLKAIWGGPQAAIRKLPESEQRFDFIVISGDLAARAHWSEYEELLAFIREHIQPYLREPDDRRRVILVPGNHDVDWTADLGEPLVVSELLAREGGPAQLERMIQRYRRDPARAGVRQIMSRFGHIEWLRLHDEKHGNRFANVQRFLNEFYGDALDQEPCRRFNLQGAREGYDWSAHIFPEDQVAFYGFNSCFLNDRYWTGAAIARESIANAAVHANEHSAGLLRVAVWHHGIHSDSYRPDYLSQADVGELIVAGYQVGFHGHTHKAAASQLGWLTDRFVLVSTGSLGANQDHRPDAVGKQFSIVQLYPHQAHVQVYERAGDVSVYTARPARSFSLSRPQERDHRVVSARRHSRHYHLDLRGISSVRVNIEGLMCPRPIQIAEIGPPVCDARGDTPRSTAPGFEVRRSATQEGAIRYTLYPPDYRRTDLSWGYEASSFLPLTRAELALAGDSAARDSSSATTVLRSHIVRFPCKALELRFTSDEPIVDPETLELRVEKQVEHHQELHWERVPSEERRCALAVTSETDLELRIEAPIVGHRYAVSYRPKIDGSRLDYTAGRIASKLLDRCRGDRERGPVLALQLAESIAVAIDAVFSVKTDDLLWSGMLWDERRRLLLTAFGNFPNRQWSHHFACGAGIAGHAFRFNRPAAWTRNAPHTKDALVYQRQRAGHIEAPEHDWVVCVPLVGDRGTSPLGVIQFEGSDKDSGFSDRLHEFANAALNREATKGSPWERFQQALSSAVNTGFWQACAVNGWLVDYRGYVGELIRALGLGTVPDDALETCEGPTSID